MKFKIAADLFVIVKLEVGVARRGERAGEQIKSASAWSCARRRGQLHFVFRPRVRGPECSPLERGPPRPPAGNALGERTCSRGRMSSDCEGTPPMAFPNRHGRGYLQQVPEEGSWGAG